MNTIITTQKELQRAKLLKVYRTKRNTFLAKELFHNLIFIGFCDYSLNYNEREHLALLLWSRKQACDFSICPSDLTKKEIWTAHLRYEIILKENYSYKDRWQLVKDSTHKQRELHFVSVVQNIQKTISNNEDLYLVPLSYHDNQACNYLKDYTNYLIAQSIKQAS